MVVGWFRVDGDVVLTTQHVISSDCDCALPDGDEHDAWCIQEDTLLDPDVFLALEPTPQAYCDSARSKSTNRILEIAVTRSKLAEVQIVRSFEDSVSAYGYTADSNMSTEIRVRVSVWSQCSKRFKITHFNNELGIATQHSDLGVAHYQVAVNAKIL